MSGVKTHRHTFEAKAAPTNSAAMNGPVHRWHANLRGAESAERSLPLDSGD
jgi:hypothetical protein